MEEVNNAVYLSLPLSASGISLVFIVFCETPAKELILSWPHLHGLSLPGSNFSCVFSPELW